MQRLLRMRGAVGRNARLRRLWGAGHRWVPGMRRRHLRQPPLPDLSAL